MQKTKGSAVVITGNENNRENDFNQRAQLTLNIQISAALIPQFQTKKTTKHNNSQSLKSVQKWKKKFKRKQQVKKSNYRTNNAKFIQIKQR